MMALTGEQAAKRIVEAAHLVRDQMHGRYGWKSEAARRLGMDPSLLNRLVAGKRKSVGMKVWSVVAPRLEAMA